MSEEYHTKSGSTFHVAVSGHTRHLPEAPPRKPTGERAAGFAALLAAKTNKPQVDGTVLLSKYDLPISEVAQEGEMTEANPLRPREKLSSESGSEGVPEVDLLGEVDLVDEDASLEELWLVGADSDLDPTVIGGEQEAIAATQFSLLEPAALYGQVPSLQTIDMGNHSLGYGVAQGDTQQRSALDAGLLQGGRKASSPLQTEPPTTDSSIQTPQEARQALAKSGPLKGSRFRQAGGLSKIEAQGTSHPSLYSGVETALKWQDTHEQLVKNAPTSAQQGLDDTLVKMESPRKIVVSDLSSLPLLEQGLKLAMDHQETSEVEQAGVSVAADRLQQLVEKLTLHITALYYGGRKETVITLQNPPLFEGAQLVMQQHGTNREFTLSFYNLNPDAAKLILDRSQQQLLREGLDNHGWTAHIHYVSQVQPPHLLGNLSPSWIDHLQDSPQDGSLSHQDSRERDNPYEEA